MISNNLEKIETTPAPKQGRTVVATKKSAEPDQIDIIQKQGRTADPSKLNNAIKNDVAKASHSKIDNSELDKAVKQINDYVQDIKRDIEFSVDDDTGRTVIRVYDSNTDELIRQIPNEEVIELAKNLKATNGLIFNAKA